MSATRGGSILFITHVGDPGGAEFKMMAIAGTMRESAEVLLLQNGSLEGLLDAAGIRCSVRPLSAGTRQVRREGGFMSLLRAIPGSLSMIRFLARKARGFDVVVCFSQKAFVLASLAKPFMRRPILWFMNDIVSVDHFHPAMIRMLMLLSRFSADGVALVSQESRNAWLRAGGRAEGVSVVISGIDPAQIARQLGDSTRVTEYRQRFSPDGQPLIGMFGRICRWKGQDVFLRALALVPNARGVIAGGALFEEKDFEGELHELAALLGVSGRVSFAGHVDDAMTLMAACEVVAHCSTAPEPSGRVIAEAMFAGTPVIGSNAGGVPEFISHGETGQLTPLNDHEALAAAMRRYLENPQWSREVAARARVRAEENFSSRATIRGFERAMESL
ncbi:MAG TPA: glycosyltransferase family 4 protein [Steroidobacteraceae bacterium]|nr:glycosyltransferase family 4 protein [Steroidobacteraceae bacterium]